MRPFLGLLRNRVGGFIPLLVHALSSRKQSFLDDRLLSHAWKASFPAWRSLFAHKKGQASNDHLPQYTPITFLPESTLATDE